jgi:transcriptional regulator with XRE-family HTH domain
LETGAALKALTMTGNRASTEEVLAERVRAARQEAGWTLQDLAQRCGVAVSTIQKIEAGQMVPSLSVLSKVANGLQRRVSFLIGEDTGELEISYCPARGRRTVQARNGVSVVSLAGDLRDPEFDAYEFFIPSGQDSGPDTVTHRGEELIICVRGRIELVIGDRVFDLRVGDSVRYKSIAPHRWRNVGRGLARVILIGCYRSHHARAMPAPLHVAEDRAPVPVRLEHDAR